MKKVYIKPAMEILNIEMQYNMLAGSVNGWGFDDELGKGLSPIYEDSVDDDGDAW